MIAKYIHDEIAKMAPFVNYSEDVVNPLFIWYLKPEYAKAAQMDVIWPTRQIVSTWLDGSGLYITF